MTLECAHCGARVETGARRCSQCLRTTGLIEVADGAGVRPGRGRSRSAVAVAGVAVVALAVGAGWYASHRASHTAPRELASEPGVRANDLPPALEGSAAVLAPFVARARTGGDVLGQAHALATALREATHATRVTAPSATPPSRTLDAIVAAMGARDGRVTSLDIARLATTVLRAAGSHDVRVAERRVGPRADTPADPTGLLGAYVVLLDARDVLDADAGELLPVNDAQPVALDDRTLGAAMLAQSALADAVPGHTDRDRSIALANAAVDGWRDGVVPLAVRSYAWRVAGGAGNPLADQDLQSAIGRRDTAPLHLLRVRLAIARGDAMTALGEAQVAYERAHGWGEAALASVALGGPRATGDGGVDRCAPLAAAREPWTDDALILCRADASTPADNAAAAARLLAASGSDPLRVAMALAGGADDANPASRVRAEDRDELANWLAVLGRRDLSDRVQGRAPDAGAARP